MTVEDFKKTCDEYINKYPELKDKIRYVYHIFMAGIKEGDPIDQTIEFGISNLKAITYEVE